MRENLDYDSLQVTRNLHPQSPAFTIRGTELKESNDLVVVGVSFDSKMTFESIFARFPEHLPKINTWYLEEVLASIP